MNRIWALTILALLALTASAVAGELTIAKNGHGNYQIVVPEKSNTAVSYAAHELQGFLQKISGAKLAIKTERKAGPGPAFLLGPSKRVQKTGLIARAKNLKGDGVLIKTVGKDIVLLGDGDRGQLYSVYVLLERFLGCRFLAHDCTVTPKRTTLTLPAIDYTYSPPFIYREELYYDASNWAFASRQRLNGGNVMAVLRRPWPDKTELIPGISIYPFAHAFCTMVPTSVYFETHPEYFGLVNGKRQGGAIGSQLCLTNPDVQRLLIEKALETFKEHPTLTSVDISQNDAYPGAYGACECENCAAIVKEEGAQHAPILRVVNAVADAVAKKYPGRYVDTLAYQYTMNPGRITKPRENVIIRLCHYGCYFHGLESEDVGKDIRTAVDSWSKLAKNIFVWHYATNFGSYLAPNPNLNGITKDIRYYASHGVNGLMIQADYQSPGGELAELRQYLTSQLMWDPTQDPMAIRTDFCKGYYGPASGEALKFLALMDKLAETTQIHGCIGWDALALANPEFVSEGLTVLNRGLTKAGSPAYRNRIEKLMMPLWLVQIASPERYGLTTEQGRETLARFKAVVKANGIINISEGFYVKDDGTAPLVANMDGWLAGMDAKYGK